jgi:calcium-dependent protein kinase
LSEDEIAGLRDMFKMLDTDNSGQIMSEELRSGLKRVGANLKGLGNCNINLRN